ncbi:helix-turn-helix domain-containing protein [Natrinema caseinilyticum]|uniref:helix-turn-helix domain-containing protein n=1 Tax=Natrinema caseinilyticum TaxID=2961570 RepID=UPI0020C59591|nr:helix-turn-helix domain-containing protein [Natrinema caseinilyticum]
MEPQEEILRLLTDGTNRAILTVLNSHNGTLSLSEVAERIVSQETTSDASNRDERISELVVALHHRHLPKLSQAGLLEYDSVRNVVSPSDSSVVDTDWLDGQTLDELRFQFGRESGSEEREIEILDGREAVYDYGRELADVADEELFLIYASGELLDEACLPHATDAIERGVSLYAGTKSEDAREFFSESLPEATIWDPQMDWMYEQSNFPKVSRLIVADRESVVVGLWRGGPGGSRSEVGMVGEGKTNPLVVLVRELLGSRLDHLDYQSDDFLGNLPFET